MGQQPVRAAFEHWYALASAAWGGSLPASTPDLEPLARRCGIHTKGLRAELLLLAVQSYLALIARLLAGHVLASCWRQPSPLAAIAASEDGERLHRLLGRLHAGPVGMALAIDREAWSTPAAGSLYAGGSRLGPRQSKPAPGDLFAWYLAAWSAPLGGLVRRVSRALLAIDSCRPASGDAPGSRRENERDAITGRKGADRIAGWTGCGRENPWAAGDLLGPLYQQLLPRRLRQKLGQYFTPDWLAEHVLDQVGFHGRPDQRVLDPTCGAGVFLLAVLRRIRGWWQKHTSESAGPGPAGSSALPGDSAALCSQVLANVVGLELEPAAVVAARASYLMAVADWLPPRSAAAIPVMLGDVLAAAGGPAPAADEDLVAPGQPSGAPFDLVVGNPPWIAWDRLSPGFRQATAPLWRRYGLFTLSGNEARHGGAKKDLAMLVLYVCADRYLRRGGRLGMVIPQTVFQTRGAGEGFRRLCLGPGGEPLRIMRVDDLARVCPFAGAANLPATIALEKGMPTQYPVRYVRWQRAEEHAWPGSDGEKAISPNVAMWLRKPARLQECLAAPVAPEQCGAAWLIRPADQSDTSSPLRGLGHSAYRAYLGANTGGANGVYWFELLGRSARGAVRARNLAECGRRQVAAEQVELEPDLLYPLLRWGDVAAFQANPSAWILLVQDPATRTGIDERLLRRRWPKTYAYLRRHKHLLGQRAALRRYQPGRPFYSMYNVGAYTLAPYKVVWRRMDQRLRAAVVEPAFDERLGWRAVIPQETCVLIPCESRQEADYLCAMLNSTPIGRLAAACSVRGGKSFGTPAILQVLGLDRFDPGCAVHRRLALLSRAAHRQARKAGQLQKAIERIDREVAGMMGKMAREVP